MGKFWTALLLLASCGRVGFDGSGDARDDSSMPCREPLSGRDEDGDMVDNSCDGCPHVADASQLDGDGDGVGDVCDPAPSTGGQRIVFFDPFDAPRSEWMDPASMVLADGALVVDARNSAIDYELLVTPMDDTVILRGVIDSAAGFPEQVTITVVTATAFLHYCELYKNGPTIKFGLVQSTAIGFTTHDSIDLPPPLAPGELDLTLVHTPPQVSCVRPAARTLNGTLLPGGGTPANFRVRATALAVRFTSLTVIRTE